MDSLILQKAETRLKDLYGEDVPLEIRERLSAETEWFKEHFGLGLVDDVIAFLKEKQKQGGYIVPRLWATSSFLLYLLGINTVNPLPILGERHQSGFDLDFIFFKDALEHPSLNLNYMGEEKEEHGNLRLEFFPSPKAKKMLQCASRLGLTQEDIEADIDSDTLVKILDYIKTRDVNAEDGLDVLPMLPNPLFVELVRLYGATDINRLAELAAAMHGIGVMEAAELFSATGVLPLGFALSRESLYRALMEKGLDSVSAFGVIKELCHNYDGHLSQGSEEKLRSLGVEQGFIDALKSIRYLFFKGNEVAELRLELRIAEKMLSRF